MKKAALLIILLLALGAGAHAASIVVAPASATKKAKARADFVCDGQDDQVELLKSLTQAGKTSLMIDRPDPSGMQKKVEGVYSDHSVEWLPGRYNLSAPLVIPDCANVAIHAEGARFLFKPAEGDAVVIQGMQGCRYNFGVIETGSTGAAIRVKPTANMPALMSVVQFNGLIGKSGQGTGLYLDSSVDNVCTNRFEGTDIAGFDRGVFISSAAEKIKYGIGKCDTNWFWFSYIRLCNTCIWEEGYHTDCNVFNVNVEAVNENSVAVRTGASFGKWYIILGTWDWHNPKRPQNPEVNKTRSIMLEPGAKGNTFEVHPPLGIFAPVENKSGNDTNLILSTDRAPFLPRKAEVKP